MQHPESLSQSLRTDAPASIVVFLVALPLCLGIALASGAPLISGLIAGIVGGVLVGSLSGSPLGVAGPAAGLAVIVLTAIEELGAFDAFLVAVVLAGVIQLALGYIRAGVIAYYFPSSVITGMLAGIGVLIFLKQIPHALGYDSDPEGDFAFRQVDGGTTFSELYDAIHYITPGAIAVAAVSLAILIAWETKAFKSHRILSRIPAPLLAVGVGLGMQVGFQGHPTLAITPEHLVSIPLTDGEAGLRGLFTFPDFRAITRYEIWETAFVLAVVASLETLLCVEATDKLDPLKRVTPTNRELKAQGVGNVVSGLLGGLPVTQVIVRSSANIQAGGKTKLSAVLHGVLLAISVLAFPDLMNQIPLATLAAVLLLVGYKLARPELFKKMYAEGKMQFIPFVATIVGIVFTDLLTGIGIGLVIAVGGLLMENYRLPFEKEHRPHEEGEHILFVLAQQVSFLNKASILQSLNAIPDGTSVEIDGSRSIYVHNDVVEIIEDFVIGAPARNIEVEVRGLGHHQKGAPIAGAEITVSVPPPPMKG